MVWLINLAALFENLTQTFYHSALNMPFIVNLFRILDFEVCHSYSYCKINKLM